MEWEQNLKKQIERVKNDPNNADAIYDMGVALQKLERRNEAIKAYKKAISINPNDADYWYALGSAYQNIKPRQLDNAIKAFERALQLQPNNDMAQAMLFVATKQKELL